MTPEELYEKFVYDAGGTKVIKRIVVANNGMAATKFIMSIRNWLFENFGDERLIHIVAMATPEVCTSPSTHSAGARTLTLAILMLTLRPSRSGHESPLRRHRRCRHLL